MAATQPFIPSKPVQEAFLEYHRYLGRQAQDLYALRDHMRRIDLAYLREEDLSIDQWRAKLANMQGDPSKFQNVTVPVVKPQVNSAVEYQVSVFLTDYPIFGVVSEPQYIDQARQLQALIEENSVRTGWVQQFNMFFFDSFKYFGVVECCWDKVVTAAIETDLSYAGGTEGKPKEVIWQGNKITRWDPYNTYMDRRCDLHDLPSIGDYAGHTELMSRTRLKQFINQLDLKIIPNVIPAFESTPGIAGGGSQQYGHSYTQPVLNISSLVQDLRSDPDDWGSFFRGDYNRKLTPTNPVGYYEVSTEYVRIIPSDFGLKVPAANTPQVWKLIWVNHAVLIYAERQTNAHEKIPVFFWQPCDEGLGQQSKSLAEDALPFQQTATALMNSIIAGRRRAITDRLVYDPSRILEAHINNPNPSAKIPVRPSAYGSPVSEAVHVLPYRDDQAGVALQEISQVVTFANLQNGLNPVRQGQFVKGNKTDSQWQDSMSASTSKDQRIAMVAEAQVFTPIKEVLKLNYLQYQGGTTIYSPSAKRSVEIDPVALRTAVLNFKVTDGLLPKEKVISSDAKKIAMQVIGSSPQLSAAYNIAPMFSYLLKVENVDFTPFEKSPQQQAYEQALSAWQQVAMTAAQKGLEISTPMPTPQQFGYDPQTTIPEPGNGTS